MGDIGMKLQGLITHRDEIHRPIMIGALGIMGGLWGLGLIVWLFIGDVIPVLFLGYIGLFIGMGLGYYLALPPHERDKGRRNMMLLVGGLVLLLALITDHGNMQIEGFFFALFAGFAPYIILHFMIAKLVGPLIFGRIWCGWACWFGMIFDLLPYPHSRYRIPGPYGLLRYVHFAVSLIFVGILWRVFGYNGGAVGSSGVLWFLAGLGLYYIAGIALALWLKDNRAFCKYLCPLAVLMKVGARYSLLKIAGDKSRCDACNVCMEMCPMNVRVPDYILNDQRVLSTECNLCQTCINLCPNDALRLSVGFDVSKKDLIDYDPPRSIKTKWEKRQQETTAHH